MGKWGREAEAYQNQCRRDNADWCNYFNEEVTENTHKGQRYYGAGEVDRGGEENLWVERGIRKTGLGWQRKKKEKEKEQRREL